jgi:hypothetical protein
MYQVIMRNDGAFFVHFKMSNGMAQAVFAKPGEEDSLYGKPAIFIHGAGNIPGILKEARRLGHDVDIYNITPTKPE